MRFITWMLVVVCALLLHVPAQATVIQDCYDNGATNLAGNTGQAWVSSSKQYGANETSFVNENTNTRYAAGCLGGYSGNDMPLPTLNLGYRGDGLFNGQPQSGGKSDPALTSGLNEWWIDGAFKPELQALADENLAVDPGWIYLGKFEENKQTSTWEKDFGKLGGVIDFGLLLDFGLRCDTDGSGDSGDANCNSTNGNWYLTPFFDVPELVAPLLGDNFFTQFAMVFKAGTNFITYNFTLQSMEIDSATVGTGLRPYVFEGGFNFGQTLMTNGGQNAGLSHFSLYALDPTGNSTTVSEPSALFILGLILVMVSVRRRLF
ncbi:hypothetical protein [Rheinheimera fenheensis]|uniref:hypothetical protein n=1 Tax=Rheinheimera fenheensis TaxID=3152295 RepID=UPI00325F8A3C